MCSACVVVCALKSARLEYAHQCQVAVEGIDDSDPSCSAQGSKLTTASTYYLQNYHGNATRRHLTSSQRV